MDSKLLKRLDAIEDQLGSNDKSGILFIPLKGETREEMDARIERWYAGEKVEGQERMYVNPDQMVMRINFVGMPDEC